MQILFSLEIELCLHFPSYILLFDQPKPAPRRRWNAKCELTPQSKQHIYLEAGSTEISWDCNQRKRYGGGEKGGYGYNNKGKTTHCETAGFPNTWLVELADDKSPWRVKQRKNAKPSLC